MRNIHNLDIENILLICPCIENDIFHCKKQSGFVFRI